ncbi:hypothetical protein IVB33_22775 [Bradyrhizobium sp. 24]|uniref:nucleotidyltransferase domain-containing protein n=1 Tax=unclassified Bradyrhizobium TaxID=2631580 RepID=UPI001FF70802|nr:MULTISPECIES: nucleotidyltransferase domain-containing protein [unclassified Bradyrhizobium]MCK1296746.1 hypothetical protein [Bradyrhizobium sp. 37]MCK1380120.1 hypothetical protein [Bradyrhizobium sp. 24]MCK1768982.1 hypothetical protein [Bradyrhizobium sp. 134]
MLSRSSSGSRAISKQARLARARGKRAEEYHELLRSRLPGAGTTVLSGSILPTTKMAAETSAFKRYEEGLRLGVVENKQVDLVPSLYDRQLADLIDQLDRDVACAEKKPIARRWSSGSMEAGSKSDGRPPNGDKSSQFQQFGCICGGTVETVPLMGARIMRALDGFGMLGFGIRILGTNAIYAYEASSGVRVDPGGWPRRRASIFCSTRAAALRLWRTTTFPSLRC